MSIVNALHPVVLFIEGKRMREWENQSKTVILLFIYFLACEGVVHTFIDYSWQLQFKWKTKTNNNQNRKRKKTLLCTTLLPLLFGAVGFVVLPVLLSNLFFFFFFFFYLTSIDDDRRVLFRVMLRGHRYEMTQLFTSHISDLIIGLCEIINNCFVSCPTAIYRTFQSVAAPFTICTDLNLFMF